MHEEDDFEESMRYLRGQFQLLNENIRLPDSLKVDQMLSLLDPPDELKKNKVNHGIMNLRTWRPLIGIAACCVIAVGAYFMVNSGAGTTVDIENGSKAPQSVAQNADNSIAEAQVGYAAAPAAYNGERSTEKKESVEIPGMTEAITIGDAKLSEKWGAYIPEYIPNGLDYQPSWYDDTGMYLTFLNSDYTIETSITITPINANISKNIVDISKPETYDLRKYGMPYSESVPEELWWMLDGAVFNLDDVTENTILARTSAIDITGHDKREYVNMKVLYAGVVIQYKSLGVPLEETLQMIKSVDM